MIRHIVFFSAKQPAQIDLIIEGLNSLEAIAEHRYFEVKRNLKYDAFENDIDVVLYSEFDSAEHLQRFVKHPLYLRCTERVKPLRELRFCTDIESK